MFLGASGDTYGDVARLLARHRAAVPGIRRARVVASRARAAFSGSRRGDGNTGVSGVSLTGRSCFLVRGSLAAPRTDRRRSGPPMLKMKTTRFGYTRVGRLYWDPVVGPGWPLSPLRGRAARPSSRLYPPERVEGRFRDLRPEGVLGSSRGPGPQACTACTGRRVAPLTTPHRKTPRGRSSARDPGRASR